MAEELRGGFETADSSDTTRTERLEEMASAETPGAGPKSRSSVQVASSGVSSANHHEAMSGNGLVPTDSAPTPSTAFKLPPNPAIAQDVSLIMEMVSSNQVVGSLPSLAMSAAAKRKLVEESIARAKAKGKERDVPPPATSSQPAPVSDTESSSEEESSSDEELDEETTTTSGRAGKSHEEMKKELDTLIGASVARGEVEMGSDSDELSSEEEEEEEEADEATSSPVLGRPGRTSIMEDLDEEGPVPSEPILSVHEDPAPPVAQPPISRLPQGEQVRLAGEVVSWMKDKKVEIWVAKEQAREEAEEALEAERMVTEDESAVERTAGALDSASGIEATAEPGEIDETPAVNGNEPVVPPIRRNEGSATAPSLPPSQLAESSKAPRFTSAGTIVVRAMQSQPGSGDDGWLEEGSVVCWEDGRVVGTISETFGPLTSPFYSIRLPPPPYPYPAPHSLSATTRLYYPSNPAYRSFVNMHAVRDPRFKGSDASNIFDEEIGEDEMEWSDDEAEAEAKRRRKASRNSRTPSVNPGRRASNASTVGLGGGHSSLPQRPHFDYQPDDVSETASMYGDEGSVYGSEDGSVVSHGSRRALPGPYDDLIGAEASPHGQGRPRGRGRGGGRGGTRSDRGGGRGRGRGGHQDHRGQYGRAPPNGAPRAIHQEHWHPPSAASYSPGAQHNRPQQSFLPPSPQYNQPMPFPSHPMPYHAPFSQPSASSQANGGFGPAVNGQPMSGQPYWQAGFQPTNPSGAPASPAINPRFAGQYNPTQQFGGNWPHMPDSE